MSIRSIGYAALSLALSITASATPASAASDTGKNANVTPLAGMISKTNHQGPTTAKHLKIGMWNTAGNVTTYTIGNSWNDWLLWLVYDKLREPSPYVGQAEDWLATDITRISDDARTWEITLREGVKWHDGTELTAEDLAFTYRYYREGPANRWTHHTSAVPRMEKIEVLAPYKVRVTSLKPMPNFDVITATDLPIIQKAQWEGVENPRSFSDIGIGTGPYMITDYKADQFYKLKANPNYWKGKPLVDELTIIMIKDPQTMFTALKTGEIDGAARSLQPELVREWVDDPNIEIAKAPSLWGVWLDVNFVREPFTNREVRRALSLAVNPEPMLERIMLGMGKSGVTGWPHVDSFWTRPGLSTTYDPEKAKAIFATEGFRDTDGDGFLENPDGSKLDWDIKVASNRPLQLRAAEMIASQLREIGIQSHVESLDPASPSALWANRKFDLRVADITPHGIADQDMVIILYNGDKKRATVPDEDRAAIVARWHEASTRNDRLNVSYELQEYEAQYPHRIMLWYPDGLFAYNWKAYDNYASSAGYGIFHKYSFLPKPARQGTAEELTK